MPIPAQLPGATERDKGAPEERMGSAIEVSAMAQLGQCCFTQGLRLTYSRLQPPIKIGHDGHRLYSWDRP
jgi:hypothetical protein